MVGYYTQRGSMSIIPSLVGIILTIVLYQYLTDAAMNGTFYLVLFEPNERKIRFFVFIPYSLKVLVLQSRAANKLEARCRPSGDHSIPICGPVGYYTQSVGYYTQSVGYKVKTDNPV